MIALTVDNISLSFGVKPILKDISFSLDESDRLGVIGVNGSGKSTLFKLILGELTADNGAIYISKDKSIGILKQDDAMAAFSEQEQKMSAIEVMYNSFPHLLRAEKRLSELEALLHSGEEGSPEYARAVNEYSTLNERFIADGGLEFRGRCASTLLKMGFDEQEQNRPFSEFSGGQRTRLALSRELCREPDILLLDEPTNHLDMETLSWLENFCCEGLLFSFTVSNVQATLSTLRCACTHTHTHTHTLSTKVPLLPLVGRPWTRDVNRILSFHDGQPTEPRRMLTFQESIPKPLKDQLVCSGHMMAHHPIMERPVVSFSLL